jgi:glucose-fructose oxidoreductase
MARPKRRRIGKRDQFAPEAAVLLGLHRQESQTEPSGRKGLQDVRIVQALYESAETGKVVQVPPFTPRMRPTGKQRITRPESASQSCIKVQSASED